MEKTQYFVQNKDSFFSCLLILELFMLFNGVYGLITSIISELTIREGLVPDQAIIYRFFGYLICLCGFFLYLIYVNKNYNLKIPSIGITALLKKNFYEHSYWEKLKYQSKAKSYVFFLIFIIILYFLGNTFIGKFNSLLVIALFTFYAYFIFFTFDNKMKLLNNKFSYFTILLIAIFINVEPLTRDLHFNSESYPSAKHAEIALEYHKANNQEIVSKPYYSIEIDDKTLSVIKMNEGMVFLGKEIRNFSTNILAWLIGDPYFGSEKFQEHSYYKINEIDGKKYFEIPQGSPSSLCFLGNYDSLLKQNSIPSSYTFENIQECTKEFEENRNTPDYTIVDTLNNIPFLFYKTKQATFDIALQFDYHENKKFTNKHSLQKETDRFADLIGSKGLFFHHYNAIVQTINIANTVFDYAGNQYGFGPLFIAKTLSDFTDFSLIDSVYLTTVWVNILILILLILITWNTTITIKFIILSFYCASIVATSCTSGMMAPYLYYIRYLPSILISLLMFYANITNKTIEKDKFLKFLFIILLLFTISYNFEYSILTSGAIIAASIISKNKFYFISGIITLFGIFIYKIALHSFLFSPSDIIAPVRYLVYFSQWGGVLIDYRSLGFLILTICFLYWVIRFNKSNKLTPEYLIILFLLFCLNIKLIWNFSINHTGGMFLLVGILISCNLILSYTHSKKNVSKDYLYKLFGFKIFVFLYISLAITVIPNFPWQYLMTTNSKFDTYSYVDTHSKIFKYSNIFLEKLKSAEQVYIDGDYFFSPMDNSIATFLGKKITKPYNDLSTNINYFSDVNRIGKYYFKQSKNERLIVDKYIDEPNTMYNVALSWFKIPSKDLRLSSYAKGLELIRKVFVIIRPYVEKCDENKHFVVYCYKN